MMGSCTELQFSCAEEGRVDLENYRSSEQDAPINQRLFNLIRQNPDWTYSRYAEELGFSEATVKRRIGELKKAGVIRREGSNKTGHWIV